IRCCDHVKCRIDGYPFSRWSTVDHIRYYHCHSISTGWKYARDQVDTSKLSYDSATADNFL
ncbi:MAG: hypothetical protein AAFW74_05645, partial [Pseudomonadota bacterium]